MLQPPEKDRAVLIQLGLTPSEIAVYISLIKNGMSQIGLISKTTGIHREHIYQIVRSLEHKCLIEKKMGQPYKYEAIPPKQTLPLLFNQKQEYITSLKTKTQYLIEKFEKNELPSYATNDIEENSQFKIIPGREVIAQRLKNTLQETQKSIDIVATCELLPTILEFALIYKKTIENKIKVRLSVEDYTPKKDFVEIIQTLKNNCGFKVKCFNHQPEAAVSIFDNKQAFVIMKSTAHLTGTVCLWSNNSSFIALLQDYFQNKWKRTLCTSS